MQKIVIVANGAPYGSESLFNSLRLAIALREQESNLDLRQFHKSTDFHPINKRKCANPAPVGTGFEQFHRYILSGKDLQHLLNVVAFPWFLPAQPGCDRIRHEEQTQIQIALLLS